MIKNLRVAIIEPVGGHGGMNHYDFGLCDGLSKAGCKVVLYTCDETISYNYCKFLVHKVYQRIYGDHPIVLRATYYIIGTVKAIISCVLTGTKICHFHFFNVGILELFNILFSKLAGRKVVITSHDVESFVDSLSIPLIAKWVYNNADAIITHNETSKRNLMKVMNVPATRINVIPHGNYLHIYNFMTEKKFARKQLRIRETSNVLLFFGQIKDVKGLDILLKAMPEIIKRHPDTILVIAGKTWKSKFSYYDDLINELGIRNCCVLHIRYIPDDKVSLYFAACDLVVLPYRKIYQSGVLLMAMSFGRPIVASDLPGMRDIVSNGYNGLLFKSEDTVSLADVISCALTDTRSLNVMSRRAYKLMRTKHDWEHIGKKTKSLYSLLV